MYTMPSIARLRFVGGLTKMVTHASCIYENGPGVLPKWSPNQDQFRMYQSGHPFCQNGRSGPANLRKWSPFYENGREVDTDHFRKFIGKP